MLPVDFKNILFRNMNRLLLKLCLRNNLKKHKSIPKFLGIQNIHIFFLQSENKKTMAVNNNFIL